MAALGAYDNNEFDEALKTFDQISDTSKILFNCGVIHATLGEHEKAVSTQQTFDVEARAHAHAGRLLPARCAAGSVPRRRILPAGCFQFPHG